MQPWHRIDQYEHPEPDILASNWVPFYRMQVANTGIILDTNRMPGLPLWENYRDNCGKTICLHRIRAPVFCHIAGQEPNEQRLMFEQHRTTK